MEINERTKIPLGLIGVVVFVAVGWMRLETRVNLVEQSAANQEKRVDGMETQISGDRSELLRVLQGMDQRLSRIEGKLSSRSRTE